jgi:uncharacterized membrane protein YkoI
MSALKPALIALALLVLAPDFISLASAETRMRCLTRDQQRAAILERRALTLAMVRRTLRKRLPGELVSARLCQEPGGRLIYLLTVLPRDGKVRRVTIDARTGAVISIR